MQSKRRPRHPRPLFPSRAMQLLLCPHLLPFRCRHRRSQEGHMLHLPAHLPQPHESQCRPRARCLWHPALLHGPVMDLRLQSDPAPSPTRTARRSRMQSPPPFQPHPRRSLPALPRRMAPMKTRMPGWRPIIQIPSPSLDAAWCSVQTVFILTTILLRSTRCATREREPVSIASARAPGQHRCHPRPLDPRELSLRKKTLLPLYMKRRRLLRGYST